MAIYSKPVHQLMKEDMTEALKLQSGKTFTRQQAINWFTHYFPKIKTGTISAHLIRLSTNAPSRTHYNAKPLDDDIFFQIDSSHYRLYDSNSDPAPIRKGVKPVADMPFEEEPTLNDDPPRGSAEFAYEADLKNYLAKNLSIIENGLKLYEEEGINGIEFPVGGRFIDILAVDSNNDFVVIELKVSRGYDRVIGQLMRYMAWIDKNQADPGQKVHGIIVAREISEDLILATTLMANIRLFEYKLSLDVKQVYVDSVT